MTLSFDDYLRHIESESARFLAVLTDCDPDARVPGCPDWTAADLLWHLTRVQDFWTHVIAHRPVAPEDYPEPERPADQAALLSRFAAQTAAFSATISAADPKDPAWSWSAEQTVGFTYRRQALEALIHRVDAEQAAGLPSDLDPALAADAVDEVLDIMYGGKPAWGTFAPLPHFVRVDITDTDSSLWVQLGRFTGTNPESGEDVDEENDIAVVADPGVEPDAVVAGPAAELALWLWRRADRGDDISVHGDLQVFDRFRVATHDAIN